MKKILFSLSAALFTFALSAQIANGDFENWDQHTFFEEPAGYSVITTSNNEAYLDQQIPNVNPISENGNTFMRIENIQGSIDVIPGYFLIGEIPTDGVAFTGGIPINDQEITGISIDLRYDMKGSSGIVLVQFTDGAQPIGPGNAGTGTYVFPITGETDWNTSEFVFEAPVHPATKACIIGIASADVFFNDNPYITGAFVEVDNINLMNSLDVVPNDDFEQWETFQGAVPHDVIVEMNPINPYVEQTQDAYSGDYAILLKNILKDEEISVGSFKMGVQGADSQAIVPTIEIENYDLLTFMYAYQASNDMAQVDIEFYENQSIVHQYSQLLPPVQDYEMIEIDLNEILLQAQTTATHIVISFHNSHNSTELPAKLASKLRVDDVELHGTTGLMPMIVKGFSQPSVVAYPNPTPGRAIFEFYTDHYGYFKVYNPSGALIAVKTFSGKQTFYDLFGKPAGNYIFKIYHNNGVETVKILKY